MKKILCVMRIPPHHEGHGGSQRGWFLAQALREIGEVHFVLISRKVDHDAATVSLAPLERTVASVTHIDIPEWNPGAERRYRIFHGGWFDLLGMRSQEAPLISDAGLRAIARRLPLRDPDVLFAGRLPSAVIAQALLDKNLVRTSRKYADYDDIMSRFRQIELQVAGTHLGFQGRLLARIDIPLIARAERRIASGWDAVSVCTDHDVSALRELHPRGAYYKIPNVVDREMLAERRPQGAVRILFVGNLNFVPNVEGLRVFVNEAWPAIRSAIPNAALAVVGINPNKEVRAIVTAHGFELFADVPTVAPFYESADLVIAPILLGSGTRIKILEALAYGRPVVSTTLGAAGIDVTHGRNILLADTMDEFAKQTIVLASDPDLRIRIAREGRALQQERYSPSALTRGIKRMIGEGTSTPRDGTAVYR